MARSPTELSLPRLGRTVILPLLGALSACGGQPSLVASTWPSAGVGVAASDAGPAVAVAPCLAARTERARVAALVDAGKLDRALRVIAHANTLCPAEASSSYGDQVDALAEIDRYAEAKAVADSIDGDPTASPDAKTRGAHARAVVRARDVAFPDSDAARAPMRAHLVDADAADAAGDHAKAKALFLQAWDEWHPNGHALYGAGRAAKESGDAAEAQRLFDRAIEDFERVGGASGVTLETPNGLHDVGGVAWSPRGDLVAVAVGKEAVVLDPVTGHEKFRLAGHEGLVSAIAFSPDGNTIATGSFDHTVRLWSRGAPRVLTGHDDYVCAVAFSPDGRSLVSGSNDATARIWRLDSDAPPEVLPHDAYVNSVAFSPDGRRVATGSIDGMLRIFTVDGSEAPRVIPHPASVDAVAFSPDGASIATASSDSTVRLWPFVHGGPPGVLEQGDDLVSSLAFAPDGQSIAVAGNRTLLISIGGEAEPARILEDDAALHVAFAPDGSAVAVAGVDDVTVVPLAEGARKRGLGHYVSNVADVAFAPDGRTLAATYGDERARVWALDRNASPVTVATAYENTNAVAYSPDARSLAIADSAGLRLYDVSNGASGPLGAGRAVAPRLGGPRALSFFPDGKTLVGTRGASDELTLWPADGSAPARVLYGAPGVVGVAIGGVAVSPDGDSVAAAFEDHLVRVFHPHAAGGAPPPIALTGHTDAVAAVAYTPDGTTLVSGSHDKTLMLWPTNSRGLPRVFGDAGYVTALAVSADGRLIADGSAEWPADRITGLGYVRLWERTSGSGSPVAVMKGHEGPVTAVAFSPGGSLLASSSRDGDVRLWSPKTHESLLTLRAIGDSDLALAFTPDGYLATFGDGARGFAMCRIGGLVFPLELCEERVVVPDLVRRIAAGDTSFRDP